jgi:hypothetical protein
MKKLLFIMIIMVTLLLPNVVSAFVNTNNDDGAVSVPKSMLTEQQKSELAKQEAYSNLQTAAGYVGLGKEIGEAVDSSLSSLTSRAEEFANTKVGIFTMIMVAYKVCGNDVIQLLIGLPLFIVLMTIVIISFFKKCISHRVVTHRSGPWWKREKEYQIVGNDRAEFAEWAHLFVGVIIIGMCCLIIFV